MSGTEWLSIYLSRSPLIERVNNSASTRGSYRIATGYLRLETHRDGTPIRSLCGGFELVRNGARITQPGTVTEHGVTHNRSTVTAAVPKGRA